ncbi:MAG: hypothetical protein Greene041679_390 [Parcubacteria group bacterium Greene0416_79]|nr:MAG: hypothetical protein Greene041679_390 [Parcubacteria group bacterium Greene0416_79]
MNTQIVDYGDVPFHLAESVLLWFREQGGATWFCDADPFLRELRETFDSGISRVFLERNAETGFLEVETIAQNGKVGREHWKFEFGRQSNSFSRV